MSSALSRLGGTFLFDSARRGKPALAVTYEVSRLTNVLGKGLDLSVSGIAGASGGGAALGTGLLYARDVRFALSNEVRGTLGLTVGPALLYGTDGGRARLGFVAGVGFRF